MNLFSVKLKWILFVLTALFLCWRIVVVNVTQYLIQGSSPSAETWGAERPEVLLASAARIAQTDPSLALQHASRAALENPTDGRALVAMALIFEQQGNLDLAGNAMRMANVLTPRSVENQLQIAQFWARHGNIEQALPHWSVALEMAPSLNRTLFPKLLRYAEFGGHRQAFTRFYNKPPIWWNSFFNYALSNSASEETLKAIYHFRASSPYGANQIEQKAYLDFLFRHGKWTDAYFVWLNGLSAEQLSVLGNIYDGSFELPASDLGYGWRYTQDDAYLVGNEQTYGTLEKMALRVVFLGPKPRKKEFAKQYLMLEAGTYTFHGRVRMDSVAAGDGLRWIITCGNGAALASSQTFTGSMPWQPFDIRLEIPPQGCEAQRLQLVMVEGIQYSLLFNGSAWFDDLTLSKQH